MGLSEDLKNVGETISAGEAKSLTLSGLKNEFIHNGETVTYEIKIGKFGPYIISSLQDENGKDLMRSIPPTLLPGTFRDEDAASLIFPPEEEKKVLFGKYELKKGRYGDYYERIDDGATVTFPRSLKKNAEDVEEPFIEMLFSLPKTIGFDKNNNAITLKIGPYGFYAQYNGKNIKVTDPVNVKVEDIIEPKEAQMAKGEYEGLPIALQSGRYGLYIKWGDENIRIPSKDKKNPEELTLDKIKEIAGDYKKRSQSGVEAEKEFLECDGIKPLLINGNYGYYIKWGNDNVPLPKEEKENPQSLTDERVKEIIEEYKKHPRAAKSFKKRRKK